jgi:hypothetical protein
MDGRFSSLELSPCSPNDNICMTLALASLDRYSVKFICHSVIIFVKLVGERFMNGGKCLTVICIIIIIIITSLFVIEVQIKFIASLVWHLQWNL